MVDATSPRARVPGRNIARTSIGKRRRLGLSFGEQVVIIYFAVFYFAPILIDLFFDLDIKYKLQGDQPTAAAFLFAALYLGVLLFLRKSVNLNIRVNIPFRNKIANPVLIFLTFGAFLLLALFFSIQFNASFRHTNSHSSAGLIPIATFCLKVIASAYVFASMSDKRFIELSWYHYALFLCAIYFSFSGSYDVIFAMICLFAWFKSSRVGLIQWVRRRFGKLGVFFLIAAVPAVVFAGLANKIGFQEAFQYLSVGGIERTIEIFSNRLFYHSYSLAYHLNHIGESFSLGLKALDIVSFQTMRRAYVLIGVVMPNETLETVSRLNYLLISGWNSSSDAGASPGMLGSLFFLPGSVFALPLHLVLIYNAIGMLDNIMGPAKYSPLAYLAGLVVMQALADSMMDKLNPIGVGFITLVIYATLSSYARTLPDPAHSARRASRQASN
ncbi:hypothetical protein [Parasphingorhabdus sp.]|uniref:hypothetical protein n=1 Tax=Parasphingorhabdus sp. TaxID=2709688 RepID=UPI003267DDED